MPIDGARDRPTLLPSFVCVRRDRWRPSRRCGRTKGGGGVYAAAKSKSRTLAVVGALLLFADYTVTASLSALDAFHYFGLPLKHQVTHAEATPQNVEDAGDHLKIHHES